MTRTYIENPSIDFTTKESQLKILEFNRQWENYKWHDETTMDMWYADFLEEFQLGKLITGTDKGEPTCYYNKLATPPADPADLVPVEYFYPCLRAWFFSDKGKEARGDIVWRVKDDYFSQIKGWRQFIIPN